VTRINDRLVIQRVETQIVLVDDSSGHETLIPMEQVPAVIATLAYLIGDDLLPLHEMLASPMLTWIDPHGAGTVRCVDELPPAVAAEWLRHMADHVDPDIEVTG
jgi:hypothetical protein